MRQPRSILCVLFVMTIISCSKGGLISTSCNPDAGERGPLDFRPADPDLTNEPTETPDLRFVPQDLREPPTVDLRPPTPDLASPNPDLRSADLRSFTEETDE